MGLVDAAVHPEMLFSPWLLNTKELVVGTGMGVGGGGSVYFICKVSEGTQALLHHRQ